MIKMQYNYYLEVIKSGTKAIFQTTPMSEPNPLSFDITKDITAPNSVGNITIYNVNQEICNKFIMCATNDEFAVKFSVGYKNNYCVVYEGIGKNGQKEVNDNLFNFNIECIGGNTIIKSTDIKLNSNSTHGQLKMLFANKLGLRLKNQANDDIKILGKKYFYSGSNLLAELRKMYSGKQYVSVADGYLIFTLNNKNSFTLGNTHLLSNQLLKCSEVDVNKKEFQLLLSPQIKDGDYIKIEEQAGYTTNYNGSYKVESVKHQGTIDYRTNLDCYTSIIATKIVAI